MKYTRGSSLVLLLFNTHTNRLANLKLNSNVYQYAEDIALVLVDDASESAVLKLQNNIRETISRFTGNYVFIDKDKTIHLMYSRTLLVK